MIFITHEKSIGRAGHQFKDALTPLIIAEIFGFTYVYPEYPVLEVFNLGEGALRRTGLREEIQIAEIQGPHWKGVPFDTLMSDFSNLILQHKDADCLILLTNSYRVQLFQAYEWYQKGQLVNNVYDRVVHKLRSNFELRNPPDTNSAGHHQIKIAVHIRRGDVADRKGRVPTSQHYAHGMEYYDRILDQLKSHLRHRELDIRIFTERLHAEDVVAYCEKSPGISLQQGGKNEFADHFKQMVYSDILVVSNSSMSQMAGYLSEGLKIYHPNDQYRDLPEDTFIPVDELTESRVVKFIDRKQNT